jgi:hypothetical protein
MFCDDRERRLAAISARIQQKSITESAPKRLIKEANFPMEIKKFNYIFKIYFKFKKISKFGFLKSLKNEKKGNKSKNKNNLFNFFQDFGHRAARRSPAPARQRHCGPRRGHPRRGGAVALTTAHF